jgi:hypothetical protein
VRSALVTLLVAAAVAVSVLASGWAAQVAALPTPERADLIAAHAASWLSRYRFVESAFSVGGAPASHAQCLEGWFPAGRRGTEHGMLLHFGRDATVVALEGHRLEELGVPGGERPQLAVVQLELAGCPRLLARRIAAALNSRPGVRIERASVADRPAIAIRVPVKRGRMVVWVTPRTYRPIALSLTLSRFTGHSRIHLTRLTPALLAAFDGRG